MHTLPDLPYAYDALEPSIDARTMEIHHTKHHQAYLDNLNAALEGHPELAPMGVGNLCMAVDNLPEPVRPAVRNHGGGHFNHSLFWTIMSPDGGGMPEGAVASAISDGFGSFDAFKDSFSKAAATRFGSGWAWLVKSADGLSVMSTPNQENPLMSGAGSPILGLDVWEHAYYLNYQNRRPDYVAAWWNLVSWAEVARRFDAA